MKKTLATLAIILIIAGAAAAQPGDADTGSGKRFSHQVGVQINELFRQVFNFGGNAAADNNNPYLFIYHGTHLRSGFGIRLGLGYNYRSIASDDGITARATDLDDLQARLGVEKIFRLSPKWSAGAGLDGIYGRNNDYTKSAVRSFDTVTTITTTKLNTYGGGAMLWLRYHLSEKVLIGTEASFYYTVGQQNDDIAITKRTFTGSGSGQLMTTFSKVDQQPKEGRLSLPVAFFLIVKF